MTQLAVGCCHVQRGNRKGALALLARAEEGLRTSAGAEPARFERDAEIDLHPRALIALAADVAARVRRDGATPALEFPRFPRRASTGP